MLKMFISRYSNHLIPFFKALKCASSGEWDAECDKAFQDIKEYLASPLVLSQPLEGEELYLYLTTSVVIVSVSMVKIDNEGRQRPMYFVSKMLIDVEFCYTNF